MDLYEGDATGCEQVVVSLPDSAPDAGFPGFAAGLRRNGILLSSPSGGPDGFGPVFETIIAGLDRLLDTQCADDGAERIRFPPAMARADFERTGFFRNFPRHVGTVHCFCGDEAEHRALLGRHARGEDWTGLQQSSDLVLTPAACYPVYPLLAHRGPVPDDGWLVDVASACFRREPSSDPARRQFFRMREHVRIGSEAQVVAFRQRWIARGRAIAGSLALPHEVVVANDPFFGRAALLMGRGQRDRNAKFELLVPITDDGNPTACMSFNLHGTHLSDAFGLARGDGPASTGCVGFGMERLALALFRHHGCTIADWPDAVRAVLDPG